MSSVNENRSEEAAAILFWGYLISILIIPLWLTAFLYIAESSLRVGGQPPSG
jgi:hypothetical protein